MRTRSRILACRFCDCRENLIELLHGYRAVIICDDQECAEALAQEFPDERLDL